MVESSYHIDALDRELIGVLRRGGRLSNSQLARETAMARGTVQSRLARLVDTGVITGWGPDLNPRATNHPVTAFATLSIAQGSHPRVLASLAKLPEVMECRMAARSNDHLHELIQSIVAIDGVIRSDSQLALQSPIQRTVADLIGG